MVVPCPSREQYQRLLAGQLDAAEEQCLEEHVKSCADCLKTLDELTAVSPEALPTTSRDPLPSPARLPVDHPADESLDRPKLAQKFLERLHKEGLAETAPWRVRAGNPLRAATGDSLPQVEGYRVLGVLGRGGMGVVYKAEEIALHRLVALKMIRGEILSDAKHRERFRTEAQAVARLQHANIVQIFAVGEVDGVPYYSLEYVESGSLAEKLAGFPQPLLPAAHLVELVARAVHFAHENGIVHRDLKPGNILLTAEGAPKIADFGLAKILEGEPGAAGATTAGEWVRGTPSYMAPEQASPDRPARQVGAAADVYALGAILYEMLTGRPPFQAQTPLETVLQVVHAEPTSPQRFRPGVPRDLETICLKCLEKAPAKRYASALALAEDLRRFQAGEPIRARPVSRAERLVRWGRRNPVVAALLATLAVVLVAAFTLVTWKWRAEAQAAERAREETRRADSAGQEAARLAARGLVDQALNQGDHGHTDRALLLLAKGLELAAQGGDPDLDHAIRVNLAAWRYQLIHRRATLPHDNWVWAVAYSPDGRLCATGSRDGTARLWSATTGQPVGEPLRHEFPVWSVAFSPDGTRLLTGSGDDKSGRGEVRLWEVPSGKSLGAVAPGGGQDVAEGRRFVLKATFSRDGRAILVLGLDAAHLWKTNGGPDATGTRPLELPHPKGARTAVLSPDGNTVLTGGADGTARLWDAATAKPVGPPLSHVPAEGLPVGQRCSVVAAAFSPDGQLILTGAQVTDPDKKKFVSGEARLWRAATGVPVGEPWPHPGPLKTVVFSPDGRRALTAGLVVEEDNPGGKPNLRGEARLWDVTTGRTIGPALKQPQPIWAAAFSPDGRLLLTGSESGDVQFWLTATGLPLGPPRHNIGNVSAVAFSPEGKTALTGRTYEPAEGTLWEVPPGQAEVLPAVQAPGTQALAFSPDGKTLATAGTGGTAQLWDVASGRRLSPPLRHGGDRVHAVAFSPDGKTVATAGSNATVRLWEVPGGTPLGQPLWHGRPVLQIAFSPDGQTLLSGGQAAQFWLWDVPSGKALRQPGKQPGWVNAFAFHPDGKTFLVSDSLGVVHQWDLATRQPRGVPFRQERDVFALAFSPDGATLAAANFDQSAYLLDAATWRPLSSPLQHPDLIRTLGFSDDGKVLVTGGADGGVRLWDVATGLRIGPLLSHTGPVLAACQPSGQKIATIAEDGLLRLWEVPRPAAGNAGTIRQWVEALTGKELADKGILRERER
jgi:WD40 repeat protein/tRNA A-37 threonylcarbamoyl transferase component Bud32